MTLMSITVLINHSIQMNDVERRLRLMMNKNVHECEKSSTAMFAVKGNPSPGMMKYVC